jgi:hypothetical protein
VVKPCLKTKTKQTKVGGVAQVVKHLLTVQYLGFNTQYCKKKVNLSHRESVNKTKPLPPLIYYLLFIVTYCKGLLREEGEITLCSTVGSTGYPLCRDHRGQGRLHHKSTSRPSQLHTESQVKMPVSWAGGVAQEIRVTA